MVHSPASRYLNLVKNIANWPVYFLRKSQKAFEPVHFITRGNRIKFSVPLKSLYLVFKEIFVSDFYDIDKLAKKLPSKPVVLDIGANAGYFDVMLFSRIKDATVYAYEPVPSNYTLFKKTIERNPSLKENIHLHNKAVTGIDMEDIELYIEASGDNSVIASVYSDFDTQNKHQIKVPTISLEKIINDNKLQQVDLMKIDCEGSEYPIIYESPAELWRKVTLLTVEVHNLDTENRNVDHLKTFLQAKGFSVQVAHAHTTCYTLNAERTR